MPHDFTDELPLWSEPDAQAVLASICVKQGVDPDVLRELIRIKREYQHMGRAHGIYEKFDDALSRMAYGCGWKQSTCKTLNPTKRLTSVFQRHGMVGTLP